MKRTSAILAPRQGAVMAWNNTVSEVLPCELCGGKPTIERRDTKGSWERRYFGSTKYRLACRNERCAGHTGFWQFRIERACGAWNNSQLAKRSTIRKAKQMLALS